MGNFEKRISTKKLYAVCLYTLENNKVKKSILQQQIRDFEHLLQVINDKDNVVDFEQQEFLEKIQKLKITQNDAYQNLIKEYHLAFAELSHAKNIVESKRKKFSEMKILLKKYRIILNKVSAQKEFLEQALKNKEFATKFYMDVLKKQSFFSKFMQKIVSNKKAGLIECSKKEHILHSFKQKKFSLNLLEHLLREASKELEIALFKEKEVFIQYSESLQKDFLEYAEAKSRSHSFMGKIAFINNIKKSGLQSLNLIFKEINFRLEKINENLLRLKEIIKTLESFVAVFKKTNNVVKAKAYALALDIFLEREQFFLEKKGKLEAIFFRLKVQDPLYIDQLKLKFKALSAKDNVIFLKNKINYLEDALLFVKKNSLHDLDNAISTKLQQENELLNDTTFLEKALGKLKFDLNSLYNTQYQQLTVGFISHLKELRDNKIAIYNISKNLATEHLKLIEVSNELQEAEDAIADLKNTIISLQQEVSQQDFFLLQPSSTNKKFNLMDFFYNIKNFFFKTQEIVFDENTDLIFTDGFLEDKNFIENVQKEKNSLLYEIDRKEFLIKQFEQKVLLKKNKKESIENQIVFLSRKLLLLFDEKRSLLDLKFLKHLYLEVDLEKLLLKKNKMLEAEKILQDAQKKYSSLSKVN